MKVLIVDDEPLARRRLRRMLEAMDDIVIVGEAGDGVVALEMIESLAPDLVLLDIHMPKRDGLGVAANTTLPAIVFTTAHAGHAVEAFELNAIDYLLKPIPKDRLERSIQRVRARREHLTTKAMHSVLEHPKRALVRVTARVGGAIHVFDPQEIVRIRATDKYSVFEARGTEFLLDESLKTLEQRLESEGFVRVHRSELINIAHVASVVREAGGIVAVMDDNQHVPVSRRLAPQLAARLR